MKIVMIGTTANSVLGFRIPLIKELIAKGNEVYAFAIDYSDLQRQLLKSLGAVPVDYMLSRSSLNVLNDLNMMFQLKAKLLAIKPDIVLSYFIKPAIYGTVAARFANIPIRIAIIEGLGYVHTASQNGYGLKKLILQRLQGILFTISFKFATRIIFLNTDDQKDLSKMALFSKSKVKVIGGIGLELLDYPYSKPDINKTIRFIFVGRLLKEKGIYELIDAIKIVHQKYPTTELVVLGGLDEDNPTGLTKKNLDDLIEQEIIIYPGHVDNVYDWLSSSHVFVLPSYREGVPRSTQEAMAVGLPIITTNVPGCRETVIDGKNGFLVPAFDAEKLAEKMKFFVEYLDQIEPMGIESLRIAEERFDVHKVNTRIIEIMRLK